jgi:hypothetical protein
VYSSLKGKQDFGAMKRIRAYSRGRWRAASQRLCALFLLTAVPVFVAIGCRKPAGPSGDVSIDASIAPQPVRTGTATVSFHLTNAAHQSVGGARVQLEGDMNHPGMAPVFSNADETSPGNYKARLDFAMGGDWVVLFHITLSDGRKVERQMDVKGVESN